MVAPQNPAAMEAGSARAWWTYTRRPAAGERFDCGSRHPINLTTQMLSILFDFFEERRKLTYWSDLATGSPEMVG